MRYTALEKFEKDKDGTIPTVTGKVQKLYHLSPVKDIKVLIPGSSKNSEKSGPKEAHRVCLSDNLHGCVQALTLPGYMMNFDTDAYGPMKHLKSAMVAKGVHIFQVYEIDSSNIDPAKVIVHESDPYSKVKIYDSELTGELGYAGRVPCKCIGELRVDMLTKDAHLSTTKYPYMFIFVRPLHENQFPQCVKDFKLSISSTVDDQLTPDLLKSDEEKFLQRIEYFMTTAARETRKVFDQILSYYRTGRF